MPVAAEIRHNLFLAFKEALHNIVKHAVAREVRVELKQESSRVILRVADNGRGFDSCGLPDNSLPKPDRIARGNGLINMKRRLAEVGGVCEITSQPGKGTTVKFTVPLRA
jgi:signal transduction histidine kinase